MKGVYYGPGARIRLYALLLAVVAALLCAAMLLEPGAKASPLDQCPSPVCESAFLKALHDKGINPDPVIAVHNGEAICTGIDAALAKGLTDEYILEMALEAVLSKSDLNVGEAGYFVGASIAAFCPQHVDMVPGTAHRRLI